MLVVMKQLQCSLLLVGTSHIHFLLTEMQFTASKEKQC